MDKDFVDRTLPPDSFGSAEQNIDITLPPGDGSGGGNSCKDELTPGTLICNRYEILEILGRGGMGVVYKCKDSVSGLTVAVKTLPQELSGDKYEMENIRTNFQLVYSLTHENIARYNALELDAKSGRCFLVMEYVNGFDLREFMRDARKSGVLNEKYISAIISQVASALDYAHAQKIIHRDIKPGNIMITASGQVKVLDFGLAAEIHSSMSRVSMKTADICGTVAYMAPEQWRGRHLSAASDQYALAAMTYEMFAGFPPFENPSMMILRDSVLNEDPEKISSISPAAWAALSKALAKDPADRFESCSAFVSALKGNVRNVPGNNVENFWKGFAGRCNQTEKNPDNSGGDDGKAKRTFVKGLKSFGFSLSWGVVSYLIYSVLAMAFGVRKGSDQVWMGLLFSVTLSFGVMLAANMLLIKYKEVDLMSIKRGRVISLVIVLIISLTGALLAKYSLFNPS